MSDYSTALSTANALDSKVQTDASKISSDYASLVALSIRQAFGATEVTAGKASSGLNATDILVFLKGTEVFSLTLSSKSVELTDSFRDFE